MSDMTPATAVIHNVTREINAVAEIAEEREHKLHSLQTGIHNASFHFKTNDGNNIRVDFSAYDPIFETLSDIISKKLRDGIAEDMKRISHLTEELKKHVG